MLQPSSSHCLVSEVSPMQDFHPPWERGYCILGFCFLSLNTGTSRGPAVPPSIHPPANKERYFGEYLERKISELNTKPSAKWKEVEEGDNPECTPFTLFTEVFHDGQTGPCTLTRIVHIKSALTNSCNNILNLCIILHFQSTSTCIFSFIYFSQEWMEVAKRSVNIFTW